MDWRATTDPATQTDLDQLLHDSLQLAVRGLAYQNLAPFMLVIGVSGDRAVRSLAAPSPGVDVDAVVATLQGRDDVTDLRARATVLDVTVREPFVGDAVNVRLEHRDGPAIDILVPYNTTPDGITVSTDSLTAAQDRPRLWSPSGAS